MKKVYLYGAGGHAKVILDILQLNNIVVEKIFDDDITIKDFMGIPVSRESGSPLIVSIGDNMIRKKIVSTFSNIRYERAISQKAIISGSALVEEGTVVMQGSIKGVKTKSAKRKCMKIQ